MKKRVAYATLDYIEYESIVGVGTGSTVNFFIEALATIKHKIDGAVSSSFETTKRLKKHGIVGIDLNTVSNIPIYIDGADEIDPLLRMLKGKGGAFTGEKIVASVAKRFICIADKRKQVNRLGQNCPVCIEVLPMARSAVGRSIVKLGANPIYREHTITDQQNVILDVSGLDLTTPILIEEKLNHIPGVVENGIFAKRPADLLLLANENNVEEIKSI